MLISMFVQQYSSAILIHYTLLLERGKGYDGIVATEPERVWYAHLYLHKEGMIYGLFNFLFLREVFVHATIL